MSCDDVKAVSLHDFIRTDPSELDFTEWVLSEYEGSDLNTWEAGQSHFYNFIQWEDEAFAYSAELDEGELQQVVRDIDGAKFTLTETLNCLGQPEYYRASYYPAGGGGAVLALWYPTNGYVLYFDKEASRNQAQIEFQGDERITSMRYIKPTTLEAAVAIEYGAPLSNHAQNVLDAIVPWSVDTMPIVVEIPQ